jgi:hypothetical protein
METKPENILSVSTLCTSGTTSQYALFNHASRLNTVFSSDMSPDEMTTNKFLKKIIPVPNLLRKIKLQEGW